MNWFLSPESNQILAKRVPIQSSKPKWITNFWSLSQSEVWYWYTKFMFAWLPNLNPVWITLNTTMLTRILIQINEKIIKICACLYNSAKHEARIVKAKYCIINLNFIWSELLAPLCLGIQPQITGKYQKKIWLAIPGWSICQNLKQTIKHFTFNQKFTPPRI